MENDKIKFDEFVKSPRPSLPRSLSSTPIGERESNNGCFLTVYEAIKFRIEFNRLFAGNEMG